MRTDPPHLLLRLTHAPGAPAAAAAAGSWELVRGAAGHFIA